MELYQNNADTKATIKTNVQMHTRAKVKAGVVGVATAVEPLSQLLYYPSLKPILLQHTQTSNHQGHGASLLPYPFYLKH